MFFRASPVEMQATISYSQLVNEYWLAWHPTNEVLGDTRLQLEDKLNRKRRHATKKTILLFISKVQAQLTKG